MNMINTIFRPTLDWIREDWQANRLRFLLELLAWADSVTVSVIMMLTVPRPPLVWLYPMWISGCAVYLWCAYSRRSFGMAANYALLTTIDTIAMIRMWING
jgi:hypothetical protein